MGDGNVLTGAIERWMRDRIRPHVEALDLFPARPAPLDLRRELAELGLLSGSEVLELGPAEVLPMLQALAAACAGVATYAAYGLAARFLRERYGSPPSGGLWTLVLGGFEGSAPPVALRAGRLWGEERSVLLAPVADGFGVLCTEGGAPRLAWVETGPQTRVGPPVGRLGLRAVPGADVAFAGAPALGSAVPLASADLRALFGLVGLYAACSAAGTAEAAVAAARTYAGERTQGGVLLREHDAVRLLLARHEAGLSSARSILFEAASLRPLESDRDARACLHARLAVGPIAVHAALDSVQVLGGYGYMRDFGLEKRLRDAVTLSVLPSDDTRLALLADRRDSALGEG